MNRKPSIRSVAFQMLAIAALALAYGCASGPSAKETVESMSDFGNETAKAKDTITSTVKSLETLTGSQAAEIKPNAAAVEMPAQWSSLGVLRRDVSRVHNFERVVEHLRADHF